MHISITAAERTAERMSADKLTQAAEAIRQNGYVIIEDIIDHDHLDILCQKMTEDTHQIVAAQEQGESVSGWKKGHLQQRPPPNLPYIFRDIVANPLAIQVTQEVLGEGLFNSFYSGNTNLPGSEEQPLHRDTYPLWPGWDQAHPASTLVVNISPIEVHEHNGSTEIWPGSHRVTGELTDALIEKQRTHTPPLRVDAKKGSVVIRDIRLWHRGVPNESDNIRHMIAMVHQISWFRRMHTLPFQRGCEQEFASDHLDANAEFVEGPVEYLFGPFINHS